MALRLTIDYSQLSGSTWVRHTAVPISYVKSDSRTFAARHHSVCVEDLPELIQDVELEVGQFQCGDLSFRAWNGDGWWGWFGETTTGDGPFVDIDPAMDWYHAPAAKRPATVKLYVDDVLSWEGDVDVASISYPSFKSPWVEFTCRGPLSRLEGYSAENVRRPIPRYSWMGTAATPGGSGTSYHIDDPTAAWPPDAFVGHALMIPATGYWWRITTNTATRITFAASSQPFSAGEPFVVRPMVFKSYEYSDSAWAVSDSTIETNYLSPAWSTDQWNPASGWPRYYVEDAEGNFFGPISDTTAHVITFPTVSGVTPVLGPFYIRKAPCRRLLELVPPTYGTASTVNDLLLEVGDQLRICSSLGRIRTLIDPWSRAYGWSKGETFSIDTLNIDYAPLDHGDASASGVGSLTDSTKAWAVDQWAGLWVLDGLGVAYQILSNTATALTLDTPETPDTGLYTILAYASPPLTAYQVWLEDDFTYDFAGEPVTLMSPYYRDATPYDLATKLFHPAQPPCFSLPLYSPNAKISIDATIEAIPYADMTDMTVGQALAKLATYANATLSCSWIDGVLWFMLQRRDLAPWEPVLVAMDPGPVIDLSVQRHWDQSYDYVRVTGPDDRSAARGVPRFGCQRLDLDAPWGASYSHLAAIADRAWSTFGRRRKTAVARIKGSFRTPQVITFNNDILGGVPEGFSEAIGSMADDFEVTTLSSIYIGLDPDDDQVVLHGKPAGSAHDAAIAVNGIGQVTNVPDLAVDLWCEGTVHPWGLMLRAYSGQYYTLTAKVSAGSPTTSILELKDQTGTTLDDAYITMSNREWYTLRVAVVDDRIRARVWYRGSTEPDAWQIDKSGLTVRAGGFGPFCHDAAGGCCWDNLTYGGVRLSLLRQITTSGTDRWTIVGITEPLVSDPAEIELRVIEGDATATLLPVLASEEFGVQDIDSNPDQPTVTEVVYLNTLHRLIRFSWPHDRSNLAWVMACLWQQQSDPDHRCRPEVGSNQLPMWVTYEGAGIWSGSIMTSLFTPGDAPWFVDLQVVLTDGRLSALSDPFVCS